MTIEIQPSERYVQFWEIRGHNNRQPHLAPSTEEEKIEATRLTNLIIDLIKDPNFEVIRERLCGLSGNWVRSGIITEDNYMSVKTTYEKIRDGHTYEEFLSSIRNKSNPQT